MRGEQKHAHSTQNTTSRAAQGGPGRIQTLHKLSVSRKSFPVPQPHISLWKKGMQGLVLGVLVCYILHICVDYLLQIIVNEPSFPVLLDRGYGISLFLWELWCNQTSIQLPKNVSLHPLPFLGAWVFPRSVCRLHFCTACAHLHRQGEIFVPKPPKLHSGCVQSLSVAPPAIHLSLSP